MAKSACFRWHKEFLEVQTSCELQGSPGAAIVALTETVINTGAAIIRTKPHLTIQKLSNILEISVGSVFTAQTFKHDYSLCSLNSAFDYTR